MSIGTILLIVLVIALVGGFSGLVAAHYGWIGLGTILVVVLILVLLGRL